MLKELYQFATAIGAARNKNNKNIAFKNCSQINDCIRKINNTQVENAKDIDVVMPMHNLIE